jgi:hypothetical protein
MSRSTNYSTVAGELLVSLKHQTCHWSYRITMSVLLETSRGDLVIDLLVEVAPKTCEKWVFL